MNTNNQQSSRTNMQPMTISQTVQVIQGSQPYSTINFSQSQGNVFMAEYSFFYKAYNDSQVYHITCKEISFEVVLSNLIQNHVSPSYLHVFYHQQPDDKKIYQVICEVVSYNFIICMLNKINYGIELGPNIQENLDFSKEHRENLEFYLKQDLNNYLAPIDISQQPMIYNNTVNQSSNYSNYSQGHINNNHN